MKSIFKRYCLIHTYLSKYVKTSNRDNYHRGAKSCLGRWIPEWSCPLVPDAMPYGIGQANGLSNAAAEARAGQTYLSVMHLVKRFQSYGIASLKWIQPPHYGNKHGLFATAEDILFRVGKQYVINFCRPAA